MYTRRTLTVLMALLLAVTSFGIIALPAVAMNGAGTVESPYVVMTASDLNQIRNNLSAHYKLGANINLTGFNPGDGKGWIPIGDDANRFTGSFDGAGYIISGLTINRPELAHVGLFGYSNGAIFKNIGLKNIDLTGSSYVGGLVSYLTGSSGIVDSVYVTGQISGTTYVGGLAGTLRTNVTNSFSTATVAATGSAGGITGYLDTGGAISMSYASGSVTGTPATTGGLTGRIKQTSVTNSYWDTQTTGQTTNAGGGSGKTTVQMRQQLTYAGWDFGNVWKIDEGNGYPQLKIFQQTGGSGGGFIDGLITDPNLQFVIPSRNKPQYLTPFTDSIFNTKITRIAGNAGTGFTLSSGGSGVWGQDVRHHYQRVQPWNSDGTLIQIQNSGSSVVYLDGETYLPKYAKCPNYDNYDDRWHPSKNHPNEMINVKNSVLTWFDVTTCTETKRINLPFNAGNFGGGKGNPTSDGRYVIMADKPANTLYLIDMELGIVGPPTVVPNNDCQLTNCDLSWGSITPSGKYVVAHYSGDVHRVYDVNLATLSLTPRQLPANSPSCQGPDLAVKRNPAVGYLYDLGHADIGVNAFDNDEEVIIGTRRSWCKVVDGVQMGSLVMVRLKDNKVTSLTNPTNEGYAHHVSLQNTERPGWVYVGYQVSPGRFNSEILAIKLDGSNAVQRFAHHHTTGTPYRNEAHGVPSRDGTRIIFASGWNADCGGGCGSSDNPQAYVVDARATNHMGGSGTVEDPYVVKSAEHLDLIRDNLSAHYKLGANISLSGFDAGDGKGWLPIGDNVSRFSGSLDGSGYKISGLTINRADIDMVGLFGYAEGAIFKNIGLENVNVVGKNYVGALVAYITGSAGSISTSYATGEASGSKHVGGLVGHLRTGMFNSYANVTVMLNGSENAGGLVGRHDLGTIDKSYAVGQVTSTGGTPIVGGISAKASTGGNTVTDSYWDTQTSGLSTSEGGGTGKTTAQMKQQATYVGWDFSNVWTISSGNYPQLRVFNR